jgi:hypothetical protein
MSSRDIRWGSRLRSRACSWAGDHGHAHAVKQNEERNVAIRTAERTPRLRSSGRPDALTRPALAASHPLSLGCRLASVIGRGPCRARKGAPNVPDPQC